MGLFFCSHGIERDFNIQVRHDPKQDLLPKGPIQLECGAGAAGNSIGPSARKERGLHDDKVGLSATRYRVLGTWYSVLINSLAS
jgi:hypothetical protein